MRNLLLLPLLVGLFACKAEPPSSPKYKKTSGNQDNSGANSEDSSLDDSSSDEGSSSEGGADEEALGKESDSSSDKKNEAESEDPQITDFSHDRAFVASGQLWSTRWLWSSYAVAASASAAEGILALADYMKLTGSREYYPAIERVYKDHRVDVNTNDFRVWNSIYKSVAWGVAFARSFELEGDEKFINASKVLADNIASAYIDKEGCDGGFNEDDRLSIAANYIILNANLHRHLKEKGNHLERAVKAWNWVAKSGYLSKDNLVYSSCNASKDFNLRGQGMLIGASVELYRATNEEKYLNLAKSLLSSSFPKLGSSSSDAFEALSGYTCSKTVGYGLAEHRAAYIANIRDLNEIIKDQKISSFFLSNAESAWKNSRKNDRIGLCWQGPYSEVEGSLQNGVQIAAIQLMASAVTRKPTNIALSKKMSSDSPSCSTDEGPEKAVDGANSTMWCSKNNSSGSNLIIDLGKKRKLHRIRIAHAAAAYLEGTERNTKDFELFVGSSAEGPWTSVAKAVDNVSTATVHEVDANAQFIRLHIIKAGDKDIARISEINVE